MSMVTVAGRFRDNRRGMLQVKAMGPGFANLVIDQAPAFGAPAQRTTIALGSEEKISDVVEQLRSLADQLEQVTDLEAWRHHEYAEPAVRRDYWWQHPDEEALA